MSSRPGRIDSTEAPASSRSSLFGSFRNFARRKSNASQKSSTSASDMRTPTTPTFGNQGDYELSYLPILYLTLPGNPFPKKARPDQLGLGVPPDEPPPPAYAPSSTSFAGPSFAPPSIQVSELAASTSPAGEDPYVFLRDFDTVLLIDDSASMYGSSWREVKQALKIIAPVVTAHDSDGMDIYFLNHKSQDRGDPSKGVAPGGYRGITRAESVDGLFNRVSPRGGTPTGTRIDNILEPYLAKLEIELKAKRKMKWLNLIVITDGVPTDCIDSILIDAAQKLDRYEARPSQVGVQFFQVGSQKGAAEALRELDDELSKLVKDKGEGRGGIRDIVDTVTWDGGAASNSLTGEGILKVVLGAVVKRLDRKPAAGRISG